MISIDKDTYTGLENLPLYKMRRAQYDLIPKFMNLTFDYLFKNYFNSVPEVSRDKLVFEIEDVYNYKGYLSTEILLMKFIDKNTKDRRGRFPVAKLFLPKLVDDNFFILRGNLYVPIFYLDSAPIQIKRNSIKLHSLFCPVTIFMSKSEVGRVVIFGNNIPISYFLKFVFNNDKDLLEEFKKVFGTTATDSSESAKFSSVLKHMARVFGIPGEDDIREIHRRFHDLFFDEWTEGLYNVFYKEKFENLRNNDDVWYFEKAEQLKKIIGIEDKSISIIDVMAYALYYAQRRKVSDYIDLTKKRISFIEVLLNPIFRSISAAISEKMGRAQSSKSSFLLTPFEMPLNTLIRHFFLNMHSQILYEPVNTYYSLNLFKATYKLPTVSGNIPKVVSSIHPTYRGKICLVSVSNKEPGVTVSFVPNVDVDLTYGIFK